MTKEKVLFQISRNEETGKYIVFYHKSLNQFEIIGLLEYAKNEQLNLCICKTKDKE